MITPQFYQAYSLIGAKKGVCGQFDMICFRNPHGSLEFDGNGWQDGGPMWVKYPEAINVRSCGNLCTSAV
jgi:hypothetical protein